MNPLTYELSHLEALEAESIHIFREVAAEFERPVLLFSQVRPPSQPRRPGLWRRAIARLKGDRDAQPDRL